MTNRFLVRLALTTLTSTLTPIVSVGCGSPRDTVQAVATDVVDCTSADVRGHYAEYGAAVEAALRAAIDPTGRVDRGQLRALAAGLGLRTGACVLASIVDRWLRPRPAVLGAPQAEGLIPDPVDLRAALRELYPEITFRLPSAPL